MKWYILGFEHCVSWYIPTARDEPASAPRTNSDRLWKGIYADYKSNWAIDNSHILVPHSACLPAHVQKWVNIWVMDVSQRPLWESFLLSVIKLWEQVACSMNSKVLVQSKSSHIKGGRSSSSSCPSVWDLCFIKQLSFCVGFFMLGPGSGSIRNNGPVMVGVVLE